MRIFNNAWYRRLWGLRFTMSSVVGVATQTEIVPNLGLPFCCEPQPGSAISNVIKTATIILVANQRSRLICARNPGHVGESVVSLVALMGASGDGQIYGSQRSALVLCD